MSYILTPATRLAIKTLSMDRPLTMGMKALLLEGEPGAGKTAFAEYVASEFSADFIVYQAHAWSDADELFVGVNVSAAVSGDADAVAEPGVLLKTAEKAETGKVVLLIDEIDKTTERAEALLLDYLQSGRVPVKPGVQVQTKMENVIVIFTSNAMRPLSDAFLRRVRRVKVSRLKMDQEVELISNKSGIRTGIARLMWRAMNEIAQADGHTPSVQEGVLACAELSLCESIEDVRLVLEAWGARTDTGRNAVARCKIVTAIWSEVLRG